MSGSRGAPDSNIDHRLLARLRQSAVGLSTRAIARSLKVRTTEVNRSLLALQQRGEVRRKGTRWQATETHRGEVSNVLPRLASRYSTQRGVGAPLHGGSSPAVDRGPATESLTRIDRSRSRWAIFRQLCEYYAECVRLDQRSPIDAKAEDEFESIVCIDGALPAPGRFKVRTRSSWNAWVRKATTTDYLFVGYPLDRFEWRDPKSGEKIVFVSPVFMAPCRFQVNGTDLELEAVTDVRVNEGWLERRLKNLEERRSFIELLGMPTSDESHSFRTWHECARLLNHYFHDWCTERLDPTSVTSTPPLRNLTSNGLVNRAALIVSRKWRYTNGLYQELISLANDVADEDLDRSSLTLLFPHQSPPAFEEPAPPITDDVSAKLVGASPLPLNHEQAIAVEASALQPLSVVVGPPGTGKSRVVATSLVQQALRGATALFSSRNHQALQAVVPRVNAMTEPWPLIIRLSRPWGSGKDESLESAIGQLVASDRTSDGRRLAQLRSALCRRIEERRDADAVVDRVTRLRQEMAVLQFELEELLREVPAKFRERVLHAAPLHPPEMLADLASKLEPPPREWYRLSALRRLVRFKLRWRKDLQLARAVDQEFREHFDPDATLPPPPKEESLRVAAFFSQGLAFWYPLSRASGTSAKLSAVERSLRSLPEFDTVLRDALDASAEASRMAQDCCRELATQTGVNLSNNERRVLADVLASMRTRSGLDDESDRRQWEQAMRRSFPVFMRHCPLIATTNLSVKRDISLDPGIFDLLIVDEASQCDIASVIPLLFRCRRAMFVGDPMQLSHVTSVSSATDRHLRRQFGVAGSELERYSFRTTSVFDLANTAERVTSRTALRQHHRCHPTIANYCNDSFYRGSWIVLTETKGDRGLVWTDTKDDCEPAPGGGAISVSQIEAIQSELSRLKVMRYEGTVGVVTPFRRQADRIRDKLFSYLPRSTTDQWHLIVDTADGFQGDERDLVLLSLVAGQNLNAGGMRFLAGAPNRFNVAVSRARRQLHVFGDAEWARSCEIPHIRRLVEAADLESQYAETHQSESFRKDLVGPVWEPALAKALSAAGLPYFQQYRACGRFLDFALIRDGLKLDVEVDGEAFHRAADGGRIEADTRRDQALIAAGWSVMRFWVYELRQDMSGCVERIAARFHRSN